MRGFQSVGEMRMDMADMARDSKKEEAMCASSLCTASHNLQEGPDGYSGRYGGHQLCPKHYRQVVDELTAWVCGVGPKPRWVD